MYLVSCLFIWYIAIHYTGIFIFLLLCKYYGKNTITSSKMVNGSYTALFYQSNQSALHSLPHSPTHTNTALYM